MTTQVTIKPCPFCGAAPQRYNATIEGGGFIGMIACDNKRCPAQPRTIFTGVTVKAVILKSIKQWNTRKGEA